MALLVSTSIATVTFPGPNSLTISLIISGFRKAALLVDILLAPASRTAAAEETSEIPPPTVNGTVVTSATFLTTSRIVDRFSTVAVMSSRASSSAPALH